MQCTDSIQCPEAIFSFFPFPCRLGKVKKKLTMFFIIHEKKIEQLHKIQNRSSTMVAFISVCCVRFFLSFFFSGWRFFFHSLFFRFVLIFRLPFFVSLDFLLALLVLCITWWQRMTMVYTL